MRITSVLAFLLLAATPVAAAAAPADRLSEGGYVERVFSSSRLDKQWFAWPWVLFLDSFSEKVKERHAKYGAYKRSDRVASHLYKVTFDHGVFYSRIELGESGLIRTMTIQDTPEAQE